MKYGIIPYYIYYNYILLYLFYTFPLFLNNCHLSSVILDVSNSLTSVSKNHTLCFLVETHKSLYIKQIKVWHCICCIISENE